MKNNKAQTWSIDIVIGVVLFLVLVVVVYTLVASSPAGNIELRRNADTLYAKFDGLRNQDENIPNIFTGNVLSEEELDKLTQKEYEQIKNALGITGDFCIVITTPQQGIQNITSNKMTYGNPNHELAIGQIDDTTIYCGEW